MNLSKCFLCKESNKLDRVSDFPRRQGQWSHAKYMKRDIRAQRILTKSIKYSLISDVPNLESSKEMYEKLVELFSVSIVGETISLRLSVGSGKSNV